MVGTALLRLLRYSLYLTIIFLAVIELIVDAVAIGGLNNLRGANVSAQRGATGYTMFVTLATLLLIPLIAFSTLLANRGLGFTSKLTTVINEVVIASVFTVLWFVAGVVMAVKSRGSCLGFSFCHKLKAATAFAWLPFFAFLFLTIALVLIMRSVRANGGSLNTPTHAIENNMEAGHSPAVAVPPQHPATSFAPDTSKNEGVYYGSNPQVNMPSPTANPQ
ncbi:hypothetical protein COEREDRAFT_82873 [Coemansia reversa NRRL 1564]|uniref:MARVEL domain-containing protein n=1 Tax=Coemansia reversa (strain ATCC 12441 / NRRL 1564) TaxID=763665 RepID=A0A2G5B5B8_COERN|nr:hypothetical protein COEREDRAFT_82873 [Coemansia reversa NRRL 1564]|eukprot:PIA14192.1 hypothetical protein COEREDRAFT_82873 [Coemansia reversa NRRL 1564]